MEVSHQLETDPADVRARRGNRQQQGLLARAGGGFQDIPDGAGFVRVHFVDTA